MLCVDLDGCLVRTDTLVESLFLFVRMHPWRLPLLLVWLLNGKAAFKERLAGAAPLSPELLPYNPEVLAFIHERRSAGATVVLATGANQATADIVAGHLGLFDAVHGSVGAHSLTGARKAQLLGARYGDFCYMGDARADLPVWAKSSEAVVVSKSRGLRAAAELNGVPVTVMAPAGGGWAAWFRVLRIYQWVKNLLVFLPVLTAHRLGDWDAVRSAGIAFVAYCCAASGTYLVNDLFDLGADRTHPRKRLRPFACGELDLLVGAGLACVLFVTGLGLAWSLSSSSALMLALYMVLTVGYSMWLKQFPLVDVLLLVCFYLIRILAGGLATGISISVWLLAFSMFFFLSLALVKRLTELRGSGWESLTPGRGYRSGDVALLGSLAGSSAYLSVVLLALYINSAEVHLLYRQPQLLWPICLVIVYWLSRMVLFANRGELDDDPIVFATGDPVSWGAGALVGIFLALAR